MPKNISFTEKAQESMAKGVDIIADAVGATMGPGGQVVAYESPMGPMTTKDGVTVARQVDLEDKFEKLGADLVKAAAGKTNDVAGDGTTTATVLARSIYRAGRKCVAAGMNPVEAKKRIDAEVERVVSVLQKNAVPVDAPEKLEQVASISANDKKLGKVIAGLISEVGKDGLITVEESPSFGIETEITKGMKLEGGYVSPFMVSDVQRMEFSVQDCYVLVTDKNITLAAEILPIMERLAKKGKKELLIIADNVEGEALSVLVVNRQRGIFTSCAVRASGIGEHRKKEQLRDICAFTGATFVSDELGKELADIKETELGICRKVVVSRESTVLVDGEGKTEDVENRLGAIRAELATTKSDYDQMKLKERLGRLSGSVGVIKVGATNEVELKELKQRVEDAVNATKSAQEEGILAGGGIALVRASQKNDVVTTALAEAFAEPFRTIVSNSGKNADVVLEKCLEKTGDFGYDASKDAYGSMYELGIIDPLKVTRAALQNAASIAGLLLTTKAAIVNKPEKT